MDQPAGREDEPRLRYVPLGTEGAAAPAASPATRLSASDKVLAVGHRDGSVTLLDHLGNQVRGRLGGAGQRLFITLFPALAASALRSMLSSPHHSPLMSPIMPSASLCYVRSRPSRSTAGR